MPAEPTNVKQFSPSKHDKTWNDDFQDSLLLQLPEDISEPEGKFDETSIIVFLVSFEKCMYNFKFNTIKLEFLQLNTLYNKLDALGLVCGGHCKLER